MTKIKEISKKKEEERRKNLTTKDKEGGRVKMRGRNGVTEKK